MSSTNGGDGLHSYSRNSSYQRGGVEIAKAMISEAIAEIFDVNQFSASSNSINIADLGCSVGPNTLIAVNNIVESIEIKCRSRGLVSEQNKVEFQVFFNDRVSNDFNTLFKTLPHDRPYFAAGVPGSFHGRLFPKASLHFISSSYALQWLSRVPKEVVDKDSPAWNKGRIYYISAPNEVVEAYKAQFGRDMVSFLNARAEELVCGGLMALLIPCLPPATPPSHCNLIALIDLLEASLLEMANMGLVSEDKVDSFNFPRYYPTFQELEEAVAKNGWFRIVKMEPLVRASANNEKALNPKALMLHMRATWEGLITEHFGSEIIEQLFDLFTDKVLESFAQSRSSPANLVELFVLLQREDQPI